MYVLTAGITIDVNELPIEHLLVIVLFILVVLSIVFINGFAIKLGEKELTIGGILRLLKKREE